LPADPLPGLRRPIQVWQSPFLSDAYRTRHGREWALPTDSVPKAQLWLPPAGLDHQPTLLG